MLPYKLTFDHTQDITGTKEWIDSLIIPENIPSLLTHYEPLTYSYHRQDKDRKALITDPLEEDQDWTLLNNGCIIICIRATD